MRWVVYTNPKFSAKRTKKRINLRDFGSGPGGSVDNLNMLNNIYKGRQDRIERYRVFDWMDNDTDIARALDIIAEHCTGRDKTSERHFEVHWRVDDVTDEEATILEDNLDQWSKLNEWENRLFRNLRAVLKYGDWFYFRHPTTFELYNIHPKLVLGALIDPEKLDVLAWIIRDFQFNIDDMELVNSNEALRNQLTNLTQGNGYEKCKVVPALNIVHLTLSEGKFSGSAADDDPTDLYSSRWPFGESILEQIYKTFKQRELLEDAALIHRVQRAPTRRVWYIDVGKMRPDRATMVVNAFKNELNEKRIPQFIGTEGKSVDSVYNPQSQLEDYYIPVTADSRGSKIENIEGIPWNDLPDLKYFTLKMFRALRVPYSFMVGPEEGGSVFQDAKVATAYMQEIEFSEFCMRHQLNLQGEYDFEFKLYLNRRGVNLNFADFKLKLNPPTNYDVYLQNLRDQDSIAVWAQLKGEPWFSPRYLAIRYLNWELDDLTENERMLLEERYPLEDTAVLDGGGAGGMGGGLGGGALGGDLLGGQAGDGELGGLGGGEAGGAGGAAGGLGGAGAAAGAASAGAGGAAGGAGGFGESRRMQINTILNEADIGLSDIQPVDHKVQDTGSYKSRTRDDKTLGADDPLQRDQPSVTLKMIRDLRTNHFEKRIQNQKRLKIIHKIYSQPPAEANPLG